MDYDPPESLANLLGIQRSAFGGFPVFTVTPPGHGPRGTLVYLHGDGSATRIAVGHWAFIVRLALVTDWTVVVPVFWLAAEPALDEFIGEVRPGAIVTVADASRPCVRMSEREANSIVNEIRGVLNWAA